MLKRLWSKPGVRVSGIPFITYRLLQELQFWCLNGMHLFGALYLRPSPKTSSWRTVPVLLYFAFSSAGWQGFSGELPYKLFSDKMLQKITVWPRRAASLMLQYTEQHFWFWVHVPWGILLVLSCDTSEYMQSKADGIDALEFSRLSLL